MKKLIYTAFTIAIIIFSCSVSYAKKENKLNSEERATQRVEKINEVCDLTPQQMADLKDAFISAINARETIKAQKKNSTGKLTAPVETQKGQLKNAMENILTPEQLAKWQSYRQKK